MKHLLIISAAALIAFAGCSAPTDTNTFSDQLVVNAFLIGGQPIDSVFVQKTGRVTELYTEEQSAVNNAIVIITGNNTVDTLAADPLHPGHYASTHRDRRVQPGASYSLLVKVQGYGDVTGSTSVPDTFSVLNAQDFAKSVKYQPVSAPLHITWNKAGNFADVMVLIRSVEPNPELIPVSYHQGDNKPDRTAIGFFMGDVNESDISWLYFNYYGKTIISVAASDRNYFEYLKQAMAAQQASDLKEIRYNLTGAIGVFGAETIANNTIELTITP
ncbi:MAG TPA: DUF4249 family protein [Bacteroidota bacterium]|nr:DUF4249 family protein [Bacteroidota bacterium]